MRVLILGAGVVGKATGLGLARFGHQVTFADNNQTALDPVQAKGYPCRLCRQGGVVPSAEVVFVCTPEDQVAAVVKSLKDVPGDLVIRSSTFPGSTEQLAIGLGRTIFHNPEFLREQTAEDDFLHSRMAILGRAAPGRAEDRVHGVMVETLYRHMGLKLVWTSATVSETVKLVLNNYLATLISYWNEVHLLCDTLGVNSHEVARIATLDSRVARYGAYRHGEPYGGRCLPKDLDRMIGFYTERGARADLLQAVRAVNELICKEAK